MKVIRNAKPKKSEMDDLIPGDIFIAQRNYNGLGERVLMVIQDYGDDEETIYFLSLEDGLSFTRYEFDELFDYIMTKTDDEVDLIVR